MDIVRNYPDGMVIQQDRAIGYLTAMLRAGVSCVRQAMNRQCYLDIMGYDSIPVDMEAPNEMQSYPYIHVMYKSNGIRPSSLDETRFGEYVDEEDVRLDDFSIYTFSGEYTLNIYATTILEREMIADCVIGAIAIDPYFKKLLVNNPYIGISPNIDTFDTRNSNESWGTPWSADVMTAFRQCSFSVIGEFVWRKTDPVEYIEAARVFSELGI